MLEYLVVAICACVLLCFRSLPYVLELLVAEICDGVSGRSNISRSWRLLKYVLELVVAEICAEVSDC